MLYRAAIQSSSLKTALVYNNAKALPIMKAQEFAPIIMANVYFIDLRMVQRFVWITVLRQCLRAVNSACINVYKINLLINSGTVLVPVFQRFMII